MASFFISLNELKISDDLEYCFGQIYSFNCLSSLSGLMTPILNSQFQYS